MHTFEKTKLESFRENNMARILILLGLLTDIFSFFCSQNLKKKTFFLKNQSTVLCLGLLFSPWWSRWVIDIFDIHAFVTKNGIAGAILLKSTYLSTTMSHFYTFNCNFPLTLLEEKILTYLIPGLCKIAVTLISLYNSYYLTFCQRLSSYIVLQK